MTMKGRNNSIRVLDQYSHESLGPHRTKTLCEYLKSLHAAMFQSVSDIIGTEAAREISQTEKRKANFEEKEKEYKHRLRNLDDRLNNFHDETKENEKTLKLYEQENRRMDEELQEANTTAQELKQLVKDHEERKEEAQKKITTLELEINELRKKKKGICG